MDTQLRVLSFNCWDLKYVAKHRKRRIQALANALEAADYDLIGLQEIWVLADFELIRSKTSKKLPYSKFFYSGAIGAGLALFSKFPILAASTHPYSLNGTPLDVASGDWFAGKAAASILVSHPVLGPLEVFNTHLHARGGEDGPEYKRAHRISNAWEFSRLVRQSTELGRFVIAMGDFNSTPSTIPMKFLIDQTRLRDAWAATHPSVTQHSLTSPHQAVHEWGVTCDSPLNTYTKGHLLEQYAQKHHGKRLDYILYRSPQRDKLQSLLKCTTSKIVLHDLVPGCDHSFSDHFGLEAHFSTSEVDERRDVSEPLDVEESERSSIQLIETVSQALTTYYRKSRADTRSRLVLFGACLSILLIAAVGSAWLPKSWITPLFIILAIVISWLATTLFYVGIIFGRMELNALTTVIEELELLKMQVRKTFRPMDIARTFEGLEMMDH